LISSLVWLTWAANESGTGDGVALIENVDDFQHRWERIQSAFVDEPRRAVEQADALVDELAPRVRGSGGRRVRSSRRPILCVAHYVDSTRSLA